MAKWSGKSKGTVLGYKIFVFFIKNLDIRAAYLILYFVALYYLLFSRQSSKSIFFYFRNILKYSSLKSVISVYKSYYTFGQVLIDKSAISLGLRNKFTYEFDGVEHLKEMLSNKRGGILISAHVGNFETAEYFFNEIDVDSRINLVRADQEHSDIKEYLDSVSSKSQLKFIFVKDDLSHIYEINNALANNEIICFTGDRYFEGTKCMENDLFGQIAKFPAGPFLLASRLNTPVAFVYVMKETNTHYHLYAKKAKFKSRNSKELLNQYTNSLEWILKKYPYQWFNYFDFWENEKF